MEMLFDIPPPGKDPADMPMVRLPRRVPFVEAPPPTASKEYQELMEFKAKSGPPPDWPAIFKKLPKDDDDNIDWMAALADKAIQPRGAIDPNAPDPGKTSDDEIELSTSGRPDKMVVFPHATHTQWLTCTNCHPAIFKKEAGSSKITMDAMDDGKYCGVCHDKVAITQPNGCKGCHKVKKKT